MAEGVAYPNICCVENRAGVDPLAQFIVREGRKPYIEEDLDGGDLVRIPFNQDSVVQTQEDSEEDNLERFEILGHAKAGERIGRLGVIKSWLFG